MARFLELPARYDYLLVLSVFSDSFLQPVLGPGHRPLVAELRWSARRARVRPLGRPQRLTRTGERGWIVPEFAWDPAGRRLLWTENRYPPDVRVDQSCLMRRLRAGIIDRLTGVDTIGGIPSDIDREIRDDVAELLRDPTGYTRREPGCGGSQAGHARRVRPADPHRATAARVESPCVRAALFITCIGDTLFPGTGRAVVEVLERLGHQVDFPEEQTCCGQMHANSGYQLEAVPLVRRFVDTFGQAEVVVSPSASCVGMVREQYADIARLAGDERAGARGARRSFRGWSS